MCETMLLSTCLSDISMINYGEEFKKEKNTNRYIQTDLLNCEKNHLQNYYNLAIPNIRENNSELKNIAKPKKKKRK